MIVERNGWWVPENDIKCLPAVIRQSAFIDNSIIKFLKNRRTCVQAGGNLGIWPKKFASIFNTVHTFEPDPVNYEALIKNTEGISNIVCYKQGLGNKPGRGAMVAPDKRNVGANFVNIYDNNGEVDVITLDSLNLTDVDLIQYDIEGAELNALKGSIDTIKKYSPVIVLEIKGLSSRYNIHPADIFNHVFDDLGYCAVNRNAFDWTFVKL